MPQEAPVRKIRKAEDAVSCKLVFIPDVDPALMRRTLELLGGRPVLTVGEDPSFLEHGGIIRLRVVRQRIRFDIARRTAERVGLRLSSNLLRVAERVVN